MVCVKLTFVTDRVTCKRCRTDLIAHVYLTRSSIHLLVFEQVNVVQGAGLALAVGAMVYNFLDKGKKKGGESGSRPVCMVCVAWWEAEG